METNKTFVEEARGSREEVSGIAIGAAVVSYICGWTGSCCRRPE